MKRPGLVLLMIALVIAGAFAVHASIWPRVIGDVAAGRRVWVAWRLETVGPPLIAAACWGGALVLAWRYGRRRRGAG